VLIEGTCTFRSGGLLRRRTCGVDPTGQCVYCGEPFCDDHGAQHEDYHEICHRERCQAKWQDLAGHKAWVARHHHDNLAGYCADDGCDEALDIPCERCSLKFCPEHIRLRTVKEIDFVGAEVVHQQMLCPHCTERRQIWE